MKEIWKDIPGFKGLYQASSFGRFKSLRFDKIIHPTFPDNRNTGILGLRNKNGTYKMVIPSRIIAQLFIPNPNKLGVVKYKKYKTNLRPSNLYWMSYSEIAKERAKSRTRIVHEYTCHNKDCKKIFVIDGTNRKYKYCSRKCSKQHISKKTRMRYSECKKKKIIAIKDGEKITFNSIEDAASYIKRSACMISNVLAGREKAAAGYTFKYLV